MKRLIEQTACEHGKWGKCRKNVQWSYFVSRPCPGGTSREVYGETVYVRHGGDTIRQVDGLQVHLVSGRYEIIPLDLEQA